MNEYSRIVIYSNSRVVMYGDDFEVDVCKEKKGNHKLFL